MNAILYFRHCKRKNVGVTSLRKYHLSVLFFPRRSVALVLRTVTRNRVCASRKTTCTCHGRHIFLLPANLHKTVLNAPSLVILKNQSEASLFIIVYLTAHDAEWRVKTNMAAAASSFVSMRNFWKDFSLPDLQV